MIPIGVSPDGININLGCGSTDLSALRAAVVERGADIGIALDGDGDRVVMCDERGAVLDGDLIMGLIASDWLDAGRLQGGGVVATVMSNLGLERYLAELGLVLERTPVGDRHVVEHMRKHGFNLGGEQSGHIVMTDHATTGDGLIAALHTLAALRVSGRRASDVAALFEPLPQLLRNVPVTKGAEVLAAPRVAEAVAKAEERLGDSGRLVIRPSGTEPLVRVMAEGDDPALIAALVEEIAATIGEAGQDVGDGGDSGLAWPFWDGLPMLEAIVSRRAPPLLPLLEAAGASVAGLRLRDGLLVLRIAQGGAAVQLLVECDRPLTPGDGLRVFLDVDLRLSVRIGQLRDLWNVVGGPVPRRGRVRGAGLGKY